MQLPLVPEVFPLSLVHSASCPSKANRPARSLSWLVRGRGVLAPLSPCSLYFYFLLFSLPATHFMQTTPHEGTSYLHLHRYKENLNSKPSPNAKSLLPHPKSLLHTAAYPSLDHNTQNEWSETANCSGPTTPQWHPSPAAIPQQK